MDRHRDGFQGVGYRKVTSGVNEGDVCIQGSKVEEARRRKQEKMVLELSLPKPGDMCYRHNLAGPEGGPRARWAQEINAINLQISPCVVVFRAESAMYLV